MQLTAMLYQTVNQFILSASFKLGSVWMCEGIIDIINPGSNFKGGMTGGKFCLVSNEFHLCTTTMKPLLSPLRSESHPT